MSNKILPLTPKTKFLVKSIQENRCLSKKVIYFFRVMHFYLALDFGFMKFKSLKARIILKVINIVQCVCVCAISFGAVLKFEGIFTKTWYGCYTFEYFFYIIILSVFNSEKSFFDLQNDLLAVDSEIQVDSRSYNLEFKFIFWLSALLLERLFFSYLICYIANEDLLFQTLTILFFIPPYLSNDIMMLMYMFTFHSVGCRVETFINFVQTQGCDIVNCLYIYKSMINSTQKALKIFEATFVIGFLCNTPQVLMTIYFVLALLKNNDVGGIAAPPGYISASITICQTLLLVFLPSYFAGKLVVYTEKLKINLHNLLLLETDAIRSRDLERFIRYIEVRPFKFTICKIIPMDWTFPVLVINISVTYLIIAIQFTQLY